MMRIFTVSDLHSDFRINREKINELSEHEYRQDTLIVAGDIATRIETISDTLSCLRARFAQVCYLPGNHELWISDESGDSIEKFYRLMELCRNLDIKTAPVRAGTHWIVPLWCWYEADFDNDDDEFKEELIGWRDFYLCRWPAEIGSPSEYFLALNEPHIKEYDAPVISFSHFLPRRDLVPPREYLFFKSLAKVAGCARLDAQVRRLNSAIHIYGHTHINYDQVIGGVRYLQHAFGYKRERERRPRALLKQII